MENDALQCGYCTPGMIMNAVAFVNKNPDPTEKEILENMEQNLCRCGAHKRIVEAVQVAAKEMGGR
jgi:aerobic-type carbon monoxide dehydrogenase small subunit (CoxS/CutS family)